MPHYQIFANIPYEPQGKVGRAPREWAKKLELSDNELDAAKLPDQKLERDCVRIICASPSTNVLFGYVCVMAWGLQGESPQTKKHAYQAWQNRKKIAEKLKTLRKGGLSRGEAYNLFYGPNHVPGLGPSYFTKLLYFFSPKREQSFYIMDQWTGKSMNILTGEHVPRMLRDNKCGTYQAFCEEVDHLAVNLDQTGEQIEERMFSRGGKGRQRGAWRNYVVRIWPTAAPHHRYSQDRMHVRYPHIPAAHF